METWFLQLVLLQEPYSFKKASIGKEEDADRDDQ